MRVRKIDIVGIEADIKWNMELSEINRLKSLNLISILANIYFFAIYIFEFYPIYKFESSYDLNIISIDQLTILDANAFVFAD